MDAVAAGNQTADLVFFEAAQRIRVLLHKRAGLIPTHIAASVLGTRVLGVLLGSLGEVELARVDLVQHVLSGCLVIGIEQDVAGALGSVVGAGVHLRILEHIVVGRLLAGGEGVVELLGLQLQLNLGTILVLGHASLLESGLPLLVAVVVGLHLVDIAIDFRAVDGNALFLGTGVDELACDVRVDDLLAHACRIGTHLSQVIAPRILVGQTLLLANALDIVGNRVLVDFGTVDGGGHRARTGVLVIAGARRR